MFYVNTLSHIEVGNDIPENLFDDFELYEKPHPPGTFFRHPYLFDSSFFLKIYYLLSYLRLYHIRNSFVSYRRSCLPGTSTYVIPK